jgi:prolipoprotein diacylglyceryltransferase
MCFFMIGNILGIIYWKFFFQFDSVPLLNSQAFKDSQAMELQFLLLLLCIFLVKNITTPLLWILDRIVIAVACYFIRLGNFFNSEIIGKETTSAWNTFPERSIYTNDAVNATCKS